MSARWLFAWVGMLAALAGTGLWVGGDEVSELSRRLGNRDGVLPHTVVLDPEGRPISARVGTYKERELEQLLEGAAGNVGQKRRT